MSVGSSDVYGLGLPAYALDTLQEAFRPLHAPGLGLHRRSSIWRLRFATFPDPRSPDSGSPTSGLRLLALPTPILRLWPPMPAPPIPDLEASNQTP